MSAVEEIEQAIATLERLRAESTPGDWDIQDDGDRFIAWHEDPDSDGFEYILSEPVEFERSADADLIVTLHRTVDDQLAILRAAASFPASSLAVMISAQPILDAALALARAINGGA